MNMSRDMDATFVNKAVAFGAMRIEGDGASFACHFFEILLRGAIGAGREELARELLASRGR
jgi:hypothetical protein